MATPTFHAELTSLTDLVVDAAGTATEIATGTYDWGTGTKSNIVAGSGIRWPSRSGIWTDPDNWTVVLVAKPDATRSGTEPSSVFTLADSGGSYLLVSFHGDYASASSPADCFAAIHYKSGSFRRGGYSSVDVCDGADHVYIARRTGTTFEEFVDGTLVTTTTITVGTATLTGTSTVASLHCSGTFGTSGQINRQAPLGMVKFYNEAITNEEVASLSADPFESGTGGTEYTLALDAGSYSITGQSILAPVTLSLDLDTGSYNVTGQDVSLLQEGSYRLNLEAGTYNIVSEEPNVGISMVLEAGTYTITGNTVRLVSSQDPVIISKSQPTVSIAIRIGL